VNGRKASGRRRRIGAGRTAGDCLLRASVVLLTSAVLLASAAAAGAQEAASPNEHLPIMSADALFDYAADRFAAGDHETALYEFKRFVHFFPRDARIAKAYFRLGQSAFHLSRYDAALSYYRRIVSRFPESETALNARFQISRCYLRKNDPEAAMGNLYQLAEKSRKPAVKDKAYYQLAWICLETARVGQARAFLERIGPAGEKTYAVDAMLAQLDRIDSLHRKSPFWAGLFSIVPGGGYLYCGRYQDAAIAFGLNAVLMAAAWESFDNDLEVLGSTIALVDAGFYAGSIYGGISSAHKYNRARYDAFINQLKADELKNEGFSINLSLGGLGPPDAPSSSRKPGVLLSLDYRF